MTTAHPSVDLAAFRSGMARLAAAVNIVTTTSEAGPVGLTASAVCSVTAEPPTLLVCVNAGSSAGEAFLAAETLCVNTVGPAHTDLAMLFGGKTPMAERFTTTAWSEGVLGAPVLDDCLVAFDCKVSDRKRVGSHEVIFAEILAVREGADDTAAAWYGRRFHDLKVG